MPSKIKLYKIKPGEEVTLTILEPPLEHHMFVDEETAKRIAGPTHDCPMCKAGIPRRPYRDRK